MSIDGIFDGAWWSTFQDMFVDEWLILFGVNQGQAYGWVLSFCIFFVGVGLLHRTIDTLKEIANLFRSDIEFAKNATISELRELAPGQLEKKAEDIVERRLAYSQRDDDIKSEDDQSDGQ